MHEAGIKGHSLPGHGIFAQQVMAWLPHGAPLRPYMYNTTEVNGAPGILSYGAQIKTRIWMDFSHLRGRVRISARHLAPVSYHDWYQLYSQKGGLENSHKNVHTSVVTPSTEHIPSTPPSKKTTTTNKPKINKQANKKNNPGK